MTRQQMLAQQIRDSQLLLMRYAKGFNTDNRTRQAQSLPNHFAWTLGHLALTLHRTAEKIDGRALPDCDFVKSDGRGGDNDRFDSESVCYGSKPLADSSLYPSDSRCISIFETAVERCANAFCNATDAQLDSRIQWGPTEVPLWTLAGRMVFHNGTHTGQLADLRRALGMGSILS
jgi:hypothetical protein